MRKFYAATKAGFRIFVYTFLMALSGLLISEAGWGQTQTFNSDGTFIVPLGVNSIKVEAWGGGGGGTSKNDRSGGGGGGAYASSTISVLPGQTYSVVVGNGGTRGNSGGASTFNTNSVVAAGGGSGSDDVGGAGGAVGASIGDIRYSGGNGGNGTNNGGGGGGGGSAYDYRNGYNGSNGGSSSGGNGGTGTGNGGRGGDQDGSPAPAAGVAPGGGGGGRGDDDGTSQSGANGRVVISYTTASYLDQWISMNTGSTTWCAGETRTISVTVKNIGTTAWTDGGGNDFNIGVKWNADADYFVRTDVANLAPGAQQTFNLTVTAPATAGTNNLTFDVVWELKSWFGNNGAGTGPGNVVYKSPNLTINALPGAPTGSASQIFCSTNTPTVANLSATGTNIKWYNAATGGTLLTGSTTLVNGTHYYASQTSASGCESTSRLDVTVTVNDPASAPTGNASQSFCAITNPTVANLAATGANIKWYAASSGGTALASGTALVNGNHYYASQTVGGCESTSRFDVTVTLDNPAAPAGSASQSFCAIDNPTVANLSATGTGIKWYATASGGTALAGSTSLVNGSHYYASQTVGGCEGTNRLDVTVTLNNTAAPTAGNNERCDAGVVSITAIAPSGSTVDWYSAATGGPLLLSGNTTYTTPSISTTTTYYAESRNTSTGCISATRTAVTATINPLPTATIGGTTTVCQNGSAPNITFTGTTGTRPFIFTYNINGGGNLTATASATNSITVSAPTGTAGTFTYNLISVSDSKSCSQNQTGSATITVNPTPTATISGDATVCKDGASPLITFTNPMDLPVTITYKINSGSNTTINVAANSTNTLNVPTGSAGTFAYNLVSVAYQTGPGCANNISGETATITVRPTPVAIISGTTTVCQDAASPNVTFTNPQSLPVTVTYDINGGTPATINIAASSTATVAAPTGTDGTFAYHLTSVKYQDGPECSNSVTGQTATITVRPTPTATISGNIAVCRNATAPFITFTNPMDLAVTVTYNINGGSNLTINVPANGTATQSAPTGTDGVIAYNLVSVQYQSGPDCPNAITGTATVTVNPLPTATISGTTTVCKDATANVTFTGANGTAPYTFTYTVSGTPGNQTVTTTFGNSVSIPVPTTSAGVLTYTLISVQDASSTACSQPQNGTAVFTIKQPVSITTDPSDYATCASFVTTFSVTATGDDLTYQWYKDGTSLSDGGFISGTQTNTLQIAYTAVGDAGSYYVVVTGASNCGAGVQSANAVLTVYEDAKIVTQPISQAVCAGSDAVLTVGATGTGLNYAWFKGNTPLTDGADYSGTDGETLTILGVNAADAANNYNVRINIPGGAHCTQVNSQNVAIIVNPVPVVNAVTNKTFCNTAPSGAINFSGGVSGTVYNWTNDNTAIGLAAAGTGNIASFTATNSTNAPITATITVTPSYTNSGNPNTTCTGTPITFTITVNPTATLNAVSDQTLCNGVPTAAINFSSPETGGTIVYNWTNSTPSIGLAATGSGNISSFTAINNGTAPVTATITVTPSFTNGVSCGGTPITFTITVNPTPKLNSSFTPPAICNNTSFSYSPSSATSGVSFSWSRAAVAGISNAASTGTGNPNETLINTTSDPITVIYEYTLSGNGCSNTQNVSVVVNPTPTLSGTLTPPDVCSNSPFTYNATSATSGVNITWTRAAVAGISNVASSGSGNINETLINTSGAPVNVTYVYTLNANGCSNTQNVVVKVNPTVTIAPLTQEVCNNTPISAITISELPTGSITSWTRTTPAGITSADIGASGSGNISGTFVNSTTAAINVVFTINAQAGNGCATTTTTTVIVNAPLVAPVIGDNQTICGIGQTPGKLIIKTDPVGGKGPYAYQWERNNPQSPGWSAIPGATGLTYQPAVDWEYRLKVTSTSGCDFVYSNVVSIASSFAISLDLSSSITPPGAFCNSESFKIHIDAFSLLREVKYGWSYNSNYIVNNSSNGTNPSSTSDWGWFIWGKDINLNTKNPENNVVNTIVRVTPYIINWDGEIGCNLSPIDFNITINPIAKINDIANITVCNGSNVTIPAFTSPTTGGTVTYSWSYSGTSIGLSPSGTGNIPNFTALNNSTTPVTRTITVTPSFTNAGKTCAGTPKTFTITVNPTPVVTATPGTQTICSNTATNIALSSNISSGSSFNWTVVSQTGVTGATSGSGNTIAQTLTANGSTPGTVTYSVTGNASGCAGPAKQITITVNPTLVPGTLSGVNSLCINQTSTFTTNGMAGGTWSSDNTGILNVSSTGVVTAISAGATNIKYSFATGCGAPVSSSISVTVNPNVIAGTVTGNPDAICIGSTTSFTSDGTTGGAWSSDNTAIATVNAANGQIIGISSGTTIIRYAVTGCNAPAPATKTITINPDANAGVLTASGSTALCIGSTVSFSSNGDAGTWSSDKPLIATVDPSTGIVTAVGAGTANITYKVTSGCNNPKSVSANVTVNPNANAGTITGNINPYYCAGSAIIMLSATGDAGGVWSSSAPGIATVNNSGQVSSLGPGVTTITYTINSGCSAPSSATTEMTFKNAGATMNPGPITAPSGSLCPGTDGFSFSIAPVTDADYYVWTLPADWTISAGNSTNTVTVKTGLQNGTVKVSAGNACVNNSATSDVVVVLRNVWSGATGTDWATGANWSDGNVASLTCGDVYIPNTTNKPVLTGSATVGNLHVLPDALVTIASTGHLSIQGSVTGTNAIDATAGTIEFNGTANQQISSDMFKDTTIANLKVSNAAGLQVVSDAGKKSLAITDMISFGTADGKLDGGGNVTLKSTYDKTASLGEVGANNTVTGDFTVERYINSGTDINKNQHGKKWIFLATPTGSDGNGQTIRQSWMENGITPPNYGIYLTNPDGAGWDAYSPAPSIKTYNMADFDKNLWKRAASANDKLYNQYGWMTFVRGDRTKTTVNAVANETTLRSKGVLKTGEVSFTMPASATGFYPIGNPYASAIDMRKVPGIMHFYVWDPNATGVPGDPSYGLGAYVTYTKTGTDFEAVGAITENNNYILSGQAFFLQPDQTVPITVTFNEASKATTTQNVTFFRGGGTSSENIPVLRTSLYSHDKLEDGTLHIFGGEYSNGVDQDDARKMMNSNINLSVKVADKLLVVERRNWFNREDTIFYNLTGAAAGKYHFIFEPENLTGHGLEAWLEDSYSKERTPVNLDGATEVNFEVTADAASKVANRFRMVFKTVPQPASFLKIEAVNDGNAVDVKWAVKQEIHVEKYVVMHSTDGTNFTDLAEVGATGINEYMTVHRSPVDGYNYYRVRSIDIFGVPTYSDIAKVFVGSAEPSLRVFPNPVQNGVIQLRLKNYPAGQYMIRLLNPAGQLMLAKTFHHGGGNGTEKIPWDYRMAHGNYHLEVRHPDGSVKVILIMW